ncbi:hypothetical protein LVJ94_39410 [Pendulispora rubella]|uniref:Uncharacterized protein n=1 Tax=Pendulispora rubella TaxID=2741070 RepID=A0ABZ2KW88_9BACT|nr:SrbN [Sorangiineae bacterium]
MTTRRNQRIAFWIAACFLGVAGCSSDDSTSNTPPPTSSGPAYAVTGRVYSPDFTQVTSLLWLVSDINGGEAKLDQAIELPGGASIWGVPQTGVFYVVSSEQLTVSKYGLNGGRPEVQGKLGLGGVGISALLGENMLFDGPNKGYLFDPKSGQALELDLAAMQIVRRISLAEVLIAGSENTFLAQNGFRKFGNRYVTAVYGTSANYDQVAPESKILFFDTSNGTMAVKKAPCGGLLYTASAPNGDVYFASDPYVASVHLISPSHSPAPCLARLAAGQDTLDPTVVTLNDVTGAPSGGLIPGSNGEAYVRVLDRTLYAPAPGATYNQAFSATAWQTWRITLDNTKPAERTDAAPLAGGITVFEVDGQAYENVSTANFATTTLRRRTGDGAPAQGLVMPGVTWGIVRIR